MVVIKFDKKNKELGMIVNESNWIDRYIGKFLVWLIFDLICGRKRFEKQYRVKKPSELIEILKDKNEKGEPINEMNLIIKILGEKKAKESIPILLSLLEKRKKKEDIGAIINALYEIDKKTFMEVVPQLIEEDDLLELNKEYIICFLEGRGIPYKIKNSKLKNDK